MKCEITKNSGNLWASVFYVLSLGSSTKNQENILGWKCFKKQETLS